MSSILVSNAFITLLKKDLSEGQYIRFEAEADDQQIIQALSLVEQLYPDQVLMLCNRSHPKLLYIGANCRHIFGFEREEFRRFKLQDFFARIHTEDVEGLRQCFEFINSAEPYNPVTHRFVLHYRFKDNKGSYIHLRDEKLAIKSQTGRYIYFSLFKNISSLEKFFSVKLDILQHSQGDVLKVCTYRPNHTDAITPRQNEIIKLILKGFSTQEIADLLKVSVNTIKNHKQVLFRKVNVKSSVELIN